MMTSGQNVWTPASNKSKSDATKQNLLERIAEIKRQHGMAPVKAVVPLKLGAEPVMVVLPPVKGVQTKPLGSGTAVRASLMQQLAAVKKRSYEAAGKSLPAPKKPRPEPTSVEPPAPVSVPSKQDEKKKEAERKVTRLFLFHFGFFF